MFDNIGMMLKLSGIWAKFSKNHPKFPQFVNAVKNNGFPADSVIDVKITYPDGKIVDTNLKISQDDLKLLEELKQLKK